jgi:hypothetical protein
MHHHTGPKHIGAEEPGLDDCHGDAQRCELVAHRFGYAAYGELCPAVEAGTCPADPGGDAAEVGDCAVGVGRGAEVREEGFAGVEGAEDVGCEDCEVLFGAWGVGVSMTVWLVLFRVVQNAPCTYDVSSMAPASA